MNFKNLKEYVSQEFGKDELIIYNIMSYEYKLKYAKAVSIENDIRPSIFLKQLNREGAKSGMSISDISLYTGLSKKQVESILKTAIFKIKKYMELHPEKTNLIKEMLNDLSHATNKE